MDRTVETTLFSYDHTSNGTLLVRHFDQSARVVRAIKAGALTLGASALTIFIPIAHFFLPFLGLLFTPFIVARNLKTSDVVTGGTGACPVCHAPVTISGRRLTWPVLENCPSCHREIEIRPKSP